MNLVTSQMGIAFNVRIGSRKTALVELESRNFKTVVLLFFFFAK